MAVKISKMTKIKDRLRSFKRAHFLRDLFTRKNCYSIMAASRSEIEVVSIKSKPIKRKALGIAARRQKSRQQFKLTKPTHLQKVHRKLVTQNKQNGFPMSVTAAQESFRGLLNNNERREIRDKESIYWFPVQKRKSVQSTLIIASKSDKYEQETKMDVYHAEVGEHINYRYEIQKVLGQGAFGQVFQCFDHKVKEVVALKVLKKNDPDGPKEVEILMKLRENDPFGEKHIIKMKDSFEFRGHLMLTFEMLNTDLEKFEKSKKGKHLAHDQVKHIAIQLLEALLYLKEEQIIHGDLKLNNIMLKNAQEIYLIDFGFACTEEGQEKTPYEPYQYRAPELLLAESPYTHSVDMWAYGVILYELHTGSTLFSGDSSVAFLRSMIDILGCPPTKMTSDAVYTRKLFGRNPSRCADIIKGLGPGKLSEKLSKLDYQLADFISKCLEWEPEKRMTPEQAFSHPWIMNGLKMRPDLSTQPQSEWSSTRSQNGADLSNLNSKWTGKLGF